jgi:hypothetical protein
MLPWFPGIEKVAAMGSPTLKILAAALLAFTLAASPALAEVEQCRFIQAKPEREACYARQEAALAARRKPAPTADTRNADTRMIETLQQMRREDAEVYRSLHGICRGC